MKAEIKQVGMITKQGKQYMIVIQKENWPKIEKMLGRKLDVVIKMEPAELTIQAS